MREEFLIEQRGKRFVLFAGLLDEHPAFERTTQLLMDAEEYEWWMGHDRASCLVCAQSLAESRGRKAGQTRTKRPIPESLRWRVWERGDFTCQHCGSRRRLSIGHILAESKGGALDMDNLQTLCVSCNSRKGAR